MQPAGTPLVDQLDTGVARAGTHSSCNDGGAPRERKKSTRIVQGIRDCGRGRKGEEAGGGNGGPHEGGVPRAHGVQDDADGDTAGGTSLKRLEGVNQKKGGLGFRLQR